MNALSLTATDPLASAKRVADSLSTQKKTSGTLKAEDANAAAASSASGTTITSNDFLSLLVTEMKNQDPTQPTDPNAYIQQLVGVNSLQQLIAINQDLTSSTSASGKAAALSSSAAL